MTAKKKTSNLAAGKNDGKGKQDLATRSQKMTAKYTLWRSKEDIKNLERIRESLNTEFNNKSYVTDSKIYKDLPDLYLNAVKKVSDQQLAIDELTAKLDQLEDLRTSFCRILELILIVTFMIQIDELKDKK